MRPTIETRVLRVQPRGASLTPWFPLTTSPLHTDFESLCGVVGRRGNEWGDSLEAKSAGLSRRKTRVRIPIVSPKEGQHAPSGNLPGKHAAEMRQYSPALSHSADV